MEKASYIVLLVFNILGVLEKMAFTLRFLGYPYNNTVKQSSPTKLQQVISIIISTNSILNVFEIDLSFVTKTVNIGGSTVPCNVCNTTARLVVPSTYIQHSTLLSTPTYKQFYCQTVANKNINFLK